MYVLSRCAVGFYLVSVNEKKILKHNVTNEIDVGVKKNTAANLSLTIRRNSLENIDN